MAADYELGVADTYDSIGKKTVATLNAENKRGFVVNATAATKKAPP